MLPVRKGTRRMALRKDDSFRIGVDLGGTKIEFVALERDGAGAGKHVVFAVILGTGCGGGIAVDGRVHSGSNGVAGEWGHNTLPWMRADEFPGPPCYCGKNGCIETWISGTGLQKDYERATKTALHGPEILARGEAGEPAELADLDRFEDRLGRGLAGRMNLLDPDVVVMGGGASQIPRVYKNVR